MAVVAVTGGSSGIGMATVERLVAGGDTVFSLARRPCTVEGASSIGVDLAEPDAAAMAVNEIMAVEGRLDALVNNAGCGALAPLEESSDDDMREIFDLNVFAPLRLARAVLPIMRAQGGGRVVNVTSLNDFLPAPFAGLYSASKAALFSASLVLDAEVRPFGVSVTVVAPGLFRTEMSQAMVGASIHDGSPYHRAFAAMVAATPARLETAADPAIVAEVIESVLHSEEPPARVVAGADAEQYEAMVRSIDTETLAGLLRDAVRGLSS